MRPVFKLFANCIPVKGARRSLLCDLQTGRMKLIPNSLFEILTEHKDRPADEIKAAYGHRYNQEIDEYFAFLTEQGWGFQCDVPELFPDLDTGYHTPDLITNAVIDSNAGSDHDYIAIMDELEDLGCKHIQFRFFDPRSLEEIEKLVKAAEGRRLRGLELLLPFGPDYADEAHLTQWCARYQRIICLVLTGAPAYNLIYTSDRKKNMGMLIYHPDVVATHQSCGVIDKLYFTVNLSLFTEAMSYNSCLNRKIAVDTLGDIKNCPSMETSFGNVRDTTLRQALSKEGFQALWPVTKDQVEICRDCEFRYICTDCRAFVEDCDKPYPKPARCGYDPYTATWGKKQDECLPV